MPCSRSRVQVPSPAPLTLEISVTRRKSKFQIDKIELDHSHNNYQYYEQKLNLDEKFELQKFIFVDGVIIDPQIELIFKYEGREFSSDISIICVGAGFENGKVLKHRKKILMKIPEDENIRKELENEMKKIGEMEFGFIPANTKSETEILRFLREEEKTIIRDILPTLKDREAIICDGTIRDFIGVEKVVVGVVKDFSWPPELIKKIPQILGENKRSRLIYEQINDKKMFSFFLKLKDSPEGTDFVARVDFISPNEKDAVALSNFLAEKISGWSQNIGDRAPKNLTPIRILEKRLRSICGDGRIIERQIRKALAS